MQLLMLGSWYLVPSVCVYYLAHTKYEKNRSTRPHAFFKFENVVGKIKSGVQPYPYETLFLIVYF